MQGSRPSGCGPDTNDPDQRQINVVLVDNDPISRHVLGNALSASRLVRLAACVDARRPVKDWPVPKPDVVVLVGGAQPDQKIVDLVAIGVRVLLVDAQWTCERLTAAIASGVAGCLVKQVDVDYLSPAVVAAASGNLVLSPELATLHASGCLPAAFGGTAAGVDDRSLRRRLSALTSREQDVLRLLARGMTTNEAAAALTISPTTVKSHVSHSLTKLGVRNRMEAVLLVQRSLIHHS